MVELRKPQRMKEILPKTNSIFNHIGYTFPIGITKTELDVLFLANWGNRNPAPIVENIQDEYGETLSDAELTVLGNLILMTYKDRWDKLKEIYNIEYDPIHNYLDEWEDEEDNSESGTTEEDVTDALTHGKIRTSAMTRTDDLEEETTFGHTSTRTDNLTQTSESSGSTDSEGNNVNSLWGFNSSNAVNADKSENTSGTTSSDESESHNTGTQTVGVTGSDVVANTGTQTNNGTVTDSGTDRRVIGKEGTNSKTGSRDRSGRHSGNIGNLTSQQQIQEEINLWKWNFVNAVLDDVKEFLTLPVYLTHLQLVD